MKRLPIGVQDFKTIRDKDYCYVDKSMLIAEVLESNPDGVSLFTRPRRFGKSLNLSMLDAFFNMEYEGNTWFDGLEISEHHEYDEHKSAYPVISVDLRKLMTMSESLFYQSARAYMSELFDKFNLLSESDILTTTEKEDFTSVCEHRSEDVYVVRALADLAKYLHKHFGKKAIVLIDEYDKPMNDSYGTDLSDKVRDFMRSMLTSVLKGSDDVEFAVITGVMQIAKESIFSGLNNLMVDNVLSEGYNEMFGFTDSEVEKICADFGHPEKYDEAKEWYDGYRFGDAEIYNPWSVLNYVKSGFKPAAYWAGTSGNDIIPALLRVADSDVYRDLAELAKGSSVAKAVEATAAYDALSRTSGSLYSVMVMTGYLKAEPSGKEGKYLLSMPNKEMYMVFTHAILSSANDDDRLVSDFADALLEDNTGAVAESLGSLLSCMGVRMAASERTYQAFILGAMMHLTGKYEITGEMEAGDGYYDIRMRRLRGEGPNVVVELKKAGDSDDMEGLAKKALEQIHARRYYDGIEGKTILYGIAIRKKDPVVLSESMELP